MNKWAEQRAEMDSNNSLWVTDDLNPGLRLMFDREVVDGKRAMMITIAPIDPNDPRQARRFSLTVLEGLRQFLDG